MVLSKVDEMLIWAETTEETEKALEMGANVNASKSYLHHRGGRTHHITALSKARDEEQALVLLRAGADIEGFQENMNISFKMKIKIIEKFQKEMQIETEKKRLQKSQEHLAEMKGEKTTSTTSPVSNTVSSDRNGRGGNGGFGDGR